MQENHVNGTRPVVASNTIAFPPAAAATRGSSLSASRFYHKSGKFKQLMPSSSSLSKTRNAAAKRKTGSDLHDHIAHIHANDPLPTTTMPPPPPSQLLPSPAKRGKLSDDGERDEGEKDKKEEKVAGAEAGAGVDAGASAGTDVTDTDIIDANAVFMSDSIIDSIKKENYKNFTSFTDRLVAAIQNNSNSGGGDIDKDRVDLSKVASVSLVPHFCDKNCKYVQLIDVATPETCDTYASALLRAGILGQCNRTDPDPEDVWVCSTTGRDFHDCRAHTCNSLESVAGSYQCTKTGLLHGNVYSGVDMSCISIVADSAVGGQGAASMCARNFSSSSATLDDRIASGAIMTPKNSGHRTLALTPWDRTRLEACRYRNVVPKRRATDALVKEKNPEISDADVAACEKLHAHFEAAIPQADKSSEFSCILADTEKFTMCELLALARSIVKRLLVDLPNWIMTMNSSGSSGGSNSQSDGHKKSVVAAYAMLVMRAWFLVDAARDMQGSMNRMYNDLVQLVTDGNNSSTESLYQTTSANERWFSQLWRSIPDSYATTTASAKAPSAIVTGVANFGGQHANKNAKITKLTQIAHGLFYMVSVGYAVVSRFTDVEVPASLLEPFLNRIGELYPTTTAATARERSQKEFARRHAMVFVPKDQYLATKLQAAYMKKNRTQQEDQISASAKIDIRAQNIGAAKLQACLAYVARWSRIKFIHDFFFHENAAGADPAASFNDLVRQFDARTELFRLAKSWVSTSNTSQSNHTS